jgi:glycosyltransferase involved in cell wall biosynthesis
MLCGCVPVATDVGGSANAIGKHGVVVRPNDADALVAGIKRAMNMKGGVGAKARKRIMTLFPKRQREERLTELIRGLSR